MLYRPDGSETAWQGTSAGRFQHVEGGVIDVARPRPGACRIEQLYVPSTDRRASEPILLGVFLEDHRSGQGLALAVGWQATAVLVEGMKRSDSILAWKLAADIGRKWLV